jgi:FixJ family two-component response regulator
MTDVETRVPFEAFIADQVVRLAAPLPRDLEREIEQAMLTLTGLIGAENCGEIRARFYSLTAREREVFALVVRGLLNKQIAGELGTSERTVKAHRANVMQKMHAASVADLARAAERLGVRS